MTSAFKGVSTSSSETGVVVAAAVVVAVVGDSEGTCVELGRLGADAGKGTLGSWSTVERSAFGTGGDLMSREGLDGGDSPSDNFALCPHSDELGVLGGEGYELACGEDSL